MVLFCGKRYTSVRTPRQEVAIPDTKILFCFSLLLFFGTLLAVVFPEIIFKLKCSVQTKGLYVQYSKMKTKTLQLQVNLIVLYFKFE